MNKVKNMRVLCEYDEFNFSYFADEKLYNDYLESNDLKDNDEVREMYGNDNFNMFFEDCVNDFKYIDELKNKKVILIDTSYFAEKIIENEANYEGEMEAFVEGIINETTIIEFDNFGDIVKYENKNGKGDLHLSILEEKEGEFGIYRRSNKLEEYIFVDKYIEDEELVKIITYRHKHNL